MTGRGQYSRTGTTASVGCVSAPSRPSSRFRVHENVHRTSLIWAPVAPIADHVDCTHQLGWRRLLYGGSMAAEGRGVRLDDQGTGSVSKSWVWKPSGDSTPFHITGRQRRTQLVLFLLPLNWHWNSFFTWTQISFFFFSLFCNQFLFMLAVILIFGWKLGKLLVKGFLGVLNMKCKEIA